VSNYCPNVSGEGTSHEKVQETVDKMSKDLVKLVSATVKRIADK
jgi:purine nucleoside phosphorylase